ncbi:hypothetical protein SAMN05444166_6617 [Singulisphaera sp. GP187]|uniref:FitA-like ribbon-helix-helix domain-containing protein n=1 Tax=Singulisphaera sp. GP187 TaxID=1882752 RepID=UPI00092B6F50|nr:hypothetical protein [Singulisphaera sp. GP187]SIO61039.1 hypothetical protein SAMN05444166_6617 [Singulisphaera sp. GP187]
MRELDDKVYERLKTIAAANNRSLEAELRSILTAASRLVTVTTARADAAALRQRLAADGRVHSDSAAMIRSDRDR